jgi:hypothetical protein
MNSQRNPVYGTRRARLHLVLYLLCFFALLAVMVYCLISLHNAVQIQPIKDLATINLPEHIKQTYFVKPRHKHIALIQIDDYALSYYYNAEQYTQRFNAVLHAVQDTIEGGYKIANGTYLISLRDGISKPYLTPILAFSANENLVAHNKVILMPDFEALQGYRILFSKLDHAIKQHPWRTKTAQIFWRGATTGSNHKAETYANFPRAQFLRHARNLDIVNACFTIYTPNLRGTRRQQLHEEFPACVNVSRTDSLKFKYLIDIDGNANSYSRTAWILYSNSLLFKHQSNLMQWYYPALKPYVHYLPVAADFSNLQQQYNWAQEHPQQVQIIMHNANVLAKQVFSKREILRSVAQAFNAYAAVSVD